MKNIFYVAILIVITNVLGYFAVQAMDKEAEMSWTKERWVQSLK